MTTKKTGLLFEPKDPQAIFETVNSLLNNQDLTKQIVENAYTQVRDKFNLNKMVKDYENLYLNLVNKGK